MLPCKSWWAESKLDFSTVFLPASSPPIHVITFTSGCPSIGHNLHIWMWQSWGYFTWFPWTHTSYSWNYINIMCTWCVVSQFSHVWLFATLWTVACQALLSVGFSRQAFWSRWPFPSPGYLPEPGLNLGLLRLLHWQANSLPLAPSGRLSVHNMYMILYIYIYI